MNTETMKFDHGAQWVRADFHLHTIVDPGQSREFRSEFNGRENDFPKEWIARLEEEGIGIAVVTNHNVFDRDEYKALRKRGRREGILVLPGVELGIKEGGGGIHTLIVFDPEGWVDNPQNDDKIKRFLDSEFTEPPNEGTRTKDDLCGCLEALDGYRHDYFVVFAHVHSDNGLLEELDGDNLGHVINRCGARWNNRVLGLQKVTRPDVVEKRWPERAPIPAYVEGSDPRNLAAVGASDRFCFLKIGEPTFASVKFALRDWSQRVTATAPIATPAPRLHSVHFRGGLLDEQTFPLNDQLTCLIGSRGSGKSSVIECLRYGLGLEAGDADLKYKNGLVSAMLANGGEVIVSGLGEDGSEFEIRRPLGYDPVVRLEGKDTRLRPSDILPGLLYFGQKDLGHRRDGFEDELFAKLTGGPGVDERTQEEQRIAAVRSAVENWRSVQRASEKEAEYLHEKEKLSHQLAVYREKGVEDQLGLLTTFDSDKRQFSEFVEQLQTLRSRLDEEPDAWNELSNDWPALKCEALAEQSASVAELKEEFDALRAEHAAVLAKFDGFLSSLRKALAAVTEKERDLQEKFAALQREIDAPGLNLTEFRAQKSRHDQLVKLLQAAGNRKEMANQALAEAEEAARSLHDLWRGWHRDEYRRLEEKSEPLPDSLELQIEFEQNRDAFRDFLKSKLAGPGFRSASYDKIVAEFPNGFALFQGREKLDDLLGGSADVEKMKSALHEHLFDFLIFRVPDKRIIRFDDVPIEELSLGQRATALLQLLMSLEGHPILLLDQPEDDLDNETIFRHVVEPLLDGKLRNQFIIATHNANIPVLGDAELVHACRESEKGRYDHSSGSLDSVATRDAIVSVMEGGADAFEQRQKIYSQWTNSLSEKKY